jgi:uncharacterized membrane protein YhaH (DUF805 family)
VNYFLTCLTSKYVAFSGRARRAEYWYYTLFLIIAWILASVADMLLGVTIDGPNGVSSGLGAFTIILSLGTLLPSLGVLVRRLHDTDRSAWWLLLYLIPLIGPLVMLVFLVLKGTDGENQYGADPITGGVDQEVFK